MPKFLTRTNILTPAIRLLVILVRGVGMVVSPRLVTALFWWLGYLASFLRPRELGIARAQIEAVSRNCESARTHPFFCQSSTLSARQSFAHVSQTFAEALLIPKILKNPSRFIESDSDNLVDELLATGKGAVCLSGHLGCFELLAAYHVSRGAPLSVIARYPNFEFLGELAESIRLAYGVELIWRENHTSPRKLYAALLGGRFLAALIDQDIKLDTRFAKFLGIEASYPIMPIRLALRQNRTILCCFIVRVGACKHRVITKRILYDKDSPTVEQEILEEYNAEFEKLVLAYPEQWIWWHRRWRRRPDIDYTNNPNQMRGTKKYLDWLETI